MFANAEALNAARHADGVTLITLPPTNTSSHTKKTLILSLVSNSEILEAPLTVCSLFFFFTSIIKSVSCGVFTQELLTSVRVGSPGTGPHICVSGIYLHSEGALCESVPALVIMWTQLRGFTCFDSRWLHTACSCAAGAVMWRRAIGCKPQSASLRGEWLSPTKGSWHVILFLPLPGLSKSLGLIEGFGGRGKGGLPATLSPAEESDAKYLREKYGYNAYLSDRISLDRTIPDHRPGKWVREWINLVFDVSSEQLQAVKLIVI